MKNKFVKMTAISIAVTLSACGGGGDSNPGSTTTAASTQTSANNANNLVKATSPGMQAFPDLQIPKNSLKCENSSTNALVGCYVAEMCNASGSASQRYLIDFRADGTTMSYIFTYSKSTTCAGQALPAGLSALSYKDVTLTENFTGANGLSVTGINATRDVFGYKTNYFSSYLVLNNRTCFPYADYDPSLSKGFTLNFTKGSADQRSSDINTETCFLKLN